MSILSENKQLQDRLKEFETMDDSLTRSGHRYKETRRQMDTLKEELFKVETCNYYLFYTIFLFSIKLTWQKIIYKNHFVFDKNKVRK